MSARGLVKLGLAGERARRACERLAGANRALEGAVKRALPHLVRRKVAVVAEGAAPVVHADAISALERPFHPLALRVGGAAAALVLDGKAIGHGLDGMLGAGRGDVPSLDPGGLTSAQSALATRLATSLVVPLGEVLEPLGAGLNVAGDGAHPPAGAALVAVTVRIGEGETAGRILLLLPASAVEGAAADERREVAQPRTEAALGGVPLEVVVELGRVRVSLARLANLRVGDVLRLPLSVDAPARLHVGGRDLFSGKPTARGSQIAVELSRHGD